jgi:hypothetical protein
MNIVKKTALGFIERSKALGYRGKKRDDALIDYWTGAAMALTNVDHPDADWMRQMAFIISVRGYSECERIANQEDVA